MPESAIHRSGPEAHWLAQGPLIRVLHTHSPPAWSELRALLVLKENAVCGNKDRFCGY
jgi:hypothetical protein